MRSTHPLGSGINEGQNQESLWDPIFITHTWWFWSISDNQELSRRKAGTRLHRRLCGPATCTGRFVNYKCSSTAGSFYLLFGIQRGTFHSSLNIFKESSLNNNMSGGYHNWVRQGKAERVRTLSACPRCSVFTSVRVFQLVFAPPPAASRLRQRLSVHGVALLIVPMWNKEKISYLQSRSQCSFKTLTDKSIRYRLVQNSLDCFSANC